MKRLALAGAAAVFAAALAISPARAGEGEITLIHASDLHGNLVPRYNMRSDGQGRLEGGLARMYTRIAEIRRRAPQSMLLVTGDAIQGSAEVMFTRGQAIVDVLNGFGVDAYAPGNWEFVYGTERFLELFAGSSPKAPWNTIAANLYYNTLAEDATTPYPAKAGERVLPPYIVKQVGGLKVGLMGFTTDRGPQVVGRRVSKGFKFTKGDAEVPEILAVLRDKEKVDLVVMMSELGLANNLRLAEANPGIHVILSADMHELTIEPVVARTGTLILEEGADGQQLGELFLKVKDGRIEAWRWTAHAITEKIAEDAAVAAKVREIRKTFLSGPDFVQHVNPFNGSKLKRPIDTVVGQTATPLHRSNFSHEEMAGVIEGSAHNFLTDAFRAVAGADIGAIRGFRYGTHVRPGPITMADLYHFMPIGPQIAKGKIKGAQLKNQIEAAANGSLDPHVANWTGGWLFNFSGVTMDVDPYKPQGQRASNIMVNGQPLDPAATYTYASYWYAADPELINVVPATDIEVVKDSDGGALDGTEVVARYLQSLPDRTANTALNRNKLLTPLPGKTFGFGEVQPLRGVAR